MMFLGVSVLHFGAFYEMGPVLYTFLHLAFTFPRWSISQYPGYRLSNASLIWCSSNIHIILFRWFNHLADSSFTILGGVLAFVFSFWERLFLVNPSWVGTYITSEVLLSVFTALFIQAQCISYASPSPPLFFLVSFKNGFGGS